MNNANNDNHSYSYYLSSEAAAIRLSKLVKRINSERTIGPSGVLCYSPCSDFYKLPTQMRIYCAMLGR